MVTISFTKTEIFTLAVALDGHAFDNQDDRILMLQIVRILNKFRKGYRLRSDKAEISLVMDIVQGYIGEKKRPLKVKK